MTPDGDFRLGELIVKPHTNTVVGPEGEAHVEPKAMQVLALLADHAGRVVSKQQILTDVWEGTFVSDEVLPNAIWELRKALGDDAKRPRFIQTLPKKGYRLIAPVITADELAASAGAPGGSEHAWSLMKRLALALPALAVAAAAALLYSGRGGGADPFGPRTPSSVLVMRFENHANAEDLAWLTTGVPTMLRTGLAEVAGVHVVSDERVDLAGIEEGAESRRELARRAGADALVLGSVFRLGAEYRIDVQVEKLADARIVAAHSARGEDVFRLVDELTGWVRDTLDGGREPRETPVHPLREMTTSSLEAFRLYNEGVEARRHLRLGDAQRLLKEAVDTDPEFALAYFELQKIALWSEDYESQERYRLLTLERRERLPPQKQALLEALEVVQEDMGRAEELLRGVIASRPDEEEAYMHLSHLYKSNYQQGESLKVLEEGVAAVPHSGYLRLYYGYGLLWHGRYPEALHQFELYSRINPEEANPWDSMGEAYLIAGIPDRALEKYARALRVDPHFSSSYLGRAWAFGQLGKFEPALSELDAMTGGLPPLFSSAERLFFRAYLLSRCGRYREADGILARFADDSGERSTGALVAGTRLLQALVDVERGKPAEALATIESAPGLDSGGGGSGSRQFQVLFRLLGGIAASRSGDPAKAKRYLAELGELFEARDPLQKWWYHLLLGEVALASGDPRAAYAAFTQGEPKHKLVFNVALVMESLGGSLIFRDGAARARALEGDRRGAIDLYRELLRPDIGQKWTAVLEPRFHLALARLARQEGERGEASKHYREFLELWSKADRNLPEIAEAETYLATAS